MLRILHCIVGMNHGGLETFTMNLLRNIDRTKVGFDFLVSLPGAYDEEIERLGGTIYRMPFITRVGPFAYARHLRRFFAQHPQYRIIHVQMDKFGGMVAREAEKCGVPVRIVHSHNTQNEGGFAFQTVKNHYGKYVLPHATHLLACGKDAAAWMFGPNAEKALVVPNGIDLSRFSALDSRDPSRFTIGHIGRFTKQKNHLFLLDVFAEVLRQNHTATLLLAGTGPLEAAVRKKADHLGILSSIQFLGARADVENVLARCDVFCFPSLFEGLPVSLVEAQAMGLPCVVSGTVSPESNLSGNVTFLPLSAPPARWAATLLAAQGQPRQNTHAALATAGYDIRKTAAAMQAFYLSLA